MPSGWLGSSLVAFMQDSPTSLVTDDIGSDGVAWTWGFARSSIQGGAQRAWDIRGTIRLAAICPHQSMLLKPRLEAPFRLDCTTVCLCFCIAVSLTASVPTRVPAIL